MKKDTPAKNKSLIVLKAIAHPVRLKIIEILLSKGICCATNANKCLKMRISQPNLSQHLRILRESGLVKSEKRGVKRCYCVRKKKELKSFLRVLKNFS